MAKAGIHFGREVPVKGFTVDFLVDQWLVIEVDGESHVLKGRAEKDASRQKAIESYGFTVLRIPAEEVRQEGRLRQRIAQVKAMIAERLSQKPGTWGPNEDYIRQVREAKKALAIGEALERARKEEAARILGPKPKESREETMDEYFGEDSEDFASLLKLYEGKELGRRRGRES